MLDATQSQLVLAPEGNNFRLGESRRLAAGWRDRAISNIVAMATAKRIEAADPERPATRDEQVRLIKFIGFGQSDLANSLFPLRGQSFREGWESIGKDLSRVATEEELAALARATQYAHFTPEFMTRAVWKGLKRLGFRGGSVLEPGVGSGLFLATMPEEIAAVSASQFVGVENDPTTARIARLLYPESTILTADFTNVSLQGGFDLAVGNPPFMNRDVAGDGLPSMSLHDFFIARSVNLLRPGAMAAFVTSRYTMDKADSTARRVITGMADLLGAIRMPEASMRNDAGTDVVVDILFLQRRDDDENVGGEDWTGLAETGLVNEGKPVWINQYFLAHPEMALGQHAITSSQWGPVYTLKAEKHAAVDIDLSNAIKRLPESVYRDGSQRQVSGAIGVVQIGTAATGARIKEGSYFLRDDELYQIEKGQPVPVKVRTKRGEEGIPASHAPIIRGLIPVRDAVRDVLRAQEKDEPCRAQQEALGRVYDQFVRKHGPINKTIITLVKKLDDEGEPIIGPDGQPVTREGYRQPNLRPFQDDPDCGLVASIEVYDRNTGKAKRGPIFTKIVLSPPPSMAIDTPADALAVVLNEIGRVDIEKIAQHLTMTEEETIAALGDTVFFDPTSKEWQAADQYLSGMVRTKLARAKEAADQDHPKFDRNVEALDKVQPTELHQDEIYMRLGMPMLTTADVERFCKETIGIETKIHFTPELNIWAVEKGPFRGTATATAVWGTARRHAGDLLEDALSQSSPRVVDEIEDPVTGKISHRLNEKETQAARDKLVKIEEAFDTWIWADKERAERLAFVYNQTMNNLVPRQFSGDHLVLPGASSIVTLTSYQKRGVWRMIIGNTMLAHTVGSGKTFCTIAGLMEQKRLGLISKPLVVVPGHTLTQWATEFMLLYPNANILLADEENFSKAKRHRFLARAATGDWDAIIVTHSAFNRIPIPADFEKKMIAEQIDQYEDLIESVSKDDRITRKRIEAAKEKLEKKYEELSKLPTDNIVHLGEIGIDYIAVDESQEFRKLSFHTSQQLKGIDPKGSKMSWHLYVATRFIKEKKPNRYLTMASGTPISNTMGEMYSIIRYMDEESLEEHKVAHFDAWASVFARTVVELELMPNGGYAPVERFAKFVNLPELANMFLKFADVVMADDLAEYVKLPRLINRQREVLDFDASPAFKDHQKILGERLRAIKNRGRRGGPGEDNHLVVIHHGRHSAIDMRTVDPASQIKKYPGLDFRVIDSLRHLDDSYVNDPTNKLNGLIANVYGIWKRTEDWIYTDPITGEPEELKGATQMVFSDLGVSNDKDFWVYGWIRDCLIRKGVPPQQIALMVDYDTISKKARVVADMNAGRKRIVIGSTGRMGTGVNAQKRLYWMHHLDVPWMPKDIGQREGRIRRQGNQNEEIGITAYVTRGSTDATMWQTVQRKQTFIDAALRGDKTVREVEDVSEVDSFALAKAMASGDERLLKAAGLQAEVARLQRKRAAHRDAQANIKKQIRDAKQEIEYAYKAIDRIELDKEQRLMTSHPDMFAVGVGYQAKTSEGDKQVMTYYHDHTEACGAIAKMISTAITYKEIGTWVALRFCGFDVIAEGSSRKMLDSSNDSYRLRLDVQRNGHRWTLVYDRDGVREGVTAPALLRRIENVILGFEADALKEEQRITDSHAKIADFSSQEGAVFGLETELAEKSAELAELEDQLAAGNDDITPEMAA